LLKHDLLKTGSHPHQVGASFFKIMLRLERDDFSSNRHHALTSSWSMIFSESRFPLFEIML